jgi:hypothetical protein
MMHSCTFSVLCLLVLLTGAYAADRSLKVTIEPIHPPVTKRFDERLALHSSDISPDDPRVQKKGKACEQPEQVGCLGGHVGMCDRRQLSLALHGQGSTTWTQQTACLRQALPSACQFSQRAMRTACAPPSVALLALVTNERHISHHDAAACQCTAMVWAPTSSKRCQLQGCTGLY